jgi:predicted Zn finger-like uncharacterized protein
MSLATKCTACGTAFRVTQEQLQAHGGKVRCGACRTVFDGLGALVTLPAAAPAAAPETEAGQIAGFELEPVAAAAGVAPEPASRDAPAVPRPEADQGPVPEQPSFEDELQPAPPARGSRWWAAGSALLALVLLAQAGYVHRSELAVQYPGLKPYLVQACGLLGCTVAPPQRPRQIAIEASDLLVPDPARPGLIQLTATLRNHAGHDLGYPALDLVLTNTKEHTLARRIFLPHEYLGRGRDAAAGIAAHAEFTIRLDLDTGDLNPAGYRLDLLRAP